MRHHHLAHFLDFTPGLRAGMRIERGQLLGRVGKSGTTYAHCHYEWTYEKPKSWTQYIYGWTKDEVIKVYGNPNEYIDRENGIPARYTTYGGYEFLSEIMEKDGSIRGFHPGVDINDGFGDADLGNPEVSPVSGKIAYIGRNEGGWGNHIWIEEDESHWSDEAMDWALTHKLIGEKKNPNINPSWGELVVFAQRLAKKIIDWSKI